MLKKSSKFLWSLYVLADVSVVVIAWIAAYNLRFSTSWAGGSYGVPPYRSYLLIILPMVIIWPFFFSKLGLYRPRRITLHLQGLFDIAKGATIATVFFVAAVYLVRKAEFSRLVFLYFWFISIALLFLERAVLMEILRYIRRKGYNVRNVVIVGANDLGLRVARTIKENPWTGLDIKGYVDDSMKAGEMLDGDKVVGRISAIKEIIKRHNVDQVFIALPIKKYSRLMYIVESLKGELVTVKVAPDIYQAITLNAGLEDFMGIPLINFTDTPMYGWSVIAKRSIDFVMASAAIIVSAPMMLVIAALIKATSPGPVFFKQQRLGLDGRPFDMIKFRSMTIDQAGDVELLTSKEDRRVTAVGRFIRRMSLDEFPQFFNVLKGDMSIVGPRPERTWVVEEVRSKIPGYMLKHKVKAGITGWAQVNGWRGNTSLERRVEHDIDYIKKWSIWFDIKIMWLTLWKGFYSRNAY